MNLNQRTYQKIMNYLMDKYSKRLWHFDDSWIISNHPQLYAKLIEILQEQHVSPASFPKAIELALIDKYGVTYKETVKAQMLTSRFRTFRYGDYNDYCSRKGFHVCT